MEASTLLCRVAVIGIVMLAVGNILHAMKLGIPTSTTSNNDAIWVPSESFMSSKNNKTMKVVKRNKVTAIIASPPKLISNIPNNKKRRKIFMVHVGKTGGETVKHTLKVTCGMRANPYHKEACYNRFNETMEESQLSLQTIGMIHCAVVLPKKGMNRSTTFLWTIRNPVQRVISWFKYIHPLNCHKERDAESTACNMKESIKRKRNKWGIKFFTCFPTINDFALALSTTTSQTASMGLLSNSSITNAAKASSYQNNRDFTFGGSDHQLLSNLTAAVNCSQMAWRAIQGESQHASHMYYNHKYYWERTMVPYPDKEIFVVRTEFLWEDMQAIEEILLRKSSSSSSLSLLPKLASMGSKQKKKKENESIPETTKFLYHNVTHGSESHVHKSNLSPIGKTNLCCALLDEIKIYFDVLDSAENLQDKTIKNKQRSKGQSIASLYQECLDSGDGSYSTKSISSSHFLKEMKKSLCRG